jgi:hypothetical protein
MANEIDWGQGAKNNAIGWGQGASNNSIGWGLSHFDSPSGETEIYGIRQDAAVSAFLTATGITDTTITSALEDLVADLKSYSIWDKMKAIYPFVGGTATTHKFNLKDSRDTDAAFRLAFSGGISHTSNGIQGNGINGYADTFLTPSTSLSLNSTHLSVYSRTNVTRNNADIGSENSDGTNRIYTLYNAVGSVDYSRNNNTLASGLSTNSSLGFILNNRTNSTNMKVIRNNSIVTANSNATTGLSDRKIYVGAYNSGGTASLFSNRQLAFSTIGDGLTDEDSANLYYSVQKFQTTLGRQVGTPIYSSNATDVNARLFLGATNIQDVTITSAVDTLVQGLKTDGVWTKLKAVYPFVGGTATTHKFNLANALDEDSAFRLAFSGGWTHSSNGALPNGTNGYANTFLNFKTILNVNSHSFGIYSRTQDVSIPAKLYGCFTGSNYLQNNVSVGDFISGAISNQLLYTPSPTTGLMLASRTTSTLFKAFRNNILLGSKTTNVVDIPTANFYFGARNENNITQASYNPYQHAFSFIGDGLTDTEASNLYTRVQAFQTTLNRAII